MRRKLPTKYVPCDGCTLCCEGDAVRLEPEDLAMNYETEPHPYILGAVMIAHKANGECFYLSDRGCSVHDHAPSQCRFADCRSVAARFDVSAALVLHRMGRLDIRVWDQGRKLLEAMGGSVSTAKHRRR